jgi:hypothetical protein
VKKWGEEGRLELGDRIMRYKSVVEDRWGGSVKQGEGGPKSQKWAGKKRAAVVGTRNVYWGVRGRGGDIAVANVQWGNESAIQQTASLPDDAMETMYTVPQVPVGPTKPRSKVKSKKRCTQL